MAHMLSKESGKIEMAYAGEVPWHGLGTKVEGLMTSAECLDKANLDWNVLIEPSYQIWNGKTRIVPDSFLTVREDTGLVLGTVGKRYAIVQNVEGLEFFDELVQEQLAMYETAGAIRDGRRVWILAKLPAHIKVGDGDELIPYVLLSNSHDGSSCLTIKPTFVRVVCNNTLQMALGDGKTVEFKIRHTKNARNKVDDAREALGLVNEYMEQSAVAFGELADLEWGGGELAEYFIEAAALTVDEDGELKTRGQNIMNVLMENLDHETNNIGDMRNTAWAAYNAVTMWVDHQRIYKQDGTLMNNAHENALFGSGEKIKERALTVALSHLA